MSRLLILLSLFVFQPAFSAGFAAVDRSMFEVGRNWRWLYSEWKPAENRWVPYYIEKYEVVATDGSLVTIEMSSSPAASSPGPAHHKFVLDFSKCERASRDPGFANFTVVFYSRSLGPDWELVSKSHGNLVFTEKFNCRSPFAGQRISERDLPLAGGSFRLFQIQTPPRTGGSWYFLNQPGFQGIAAFKEFPPTGQYKFELLEPVPAAL